MASNNEIIGQLPKMLSGDELLVCMRRLPNYDKSIRNADAPIRLMELSNLYDIYIPNAMSTEIYSKLYLAMLRSLQKKNSRLMTLQQKENGKAINGLEYCGIMGGSDSFTIIGASGIGKSTAIATSINVMEGHKVIEIDSPYMKVIPCLIVQCPFDSSVKGLLLEVLRKVDERLETKYHQNALRTHATIDMLIGIVTLPIVQEIIKKEYELVDPRPSRINCSYICGKLGKHSKYLDKLPKCKQYVIDNQEMMEEYWAREIAWAISKIQKENGVVNWRGIRDLTNLSKANYLRTISYFGNKNIEICSRIREDQG